MKSPLLFHVSQRPDGLVFGFPLVTERALREGFPEARLAERLFIALPTLDALRETRADFWRQVLSFLTGLSPAQLATLGGWRFVDPTTGEQFDEGPAQDRAA